MDFATDTMAIKDWVEPRSLDDLLGFMRHRRACPEALKAAEGAFEKWQRFDPKARIDGLSANDVEKIRRATRQVWGWSFPRRICIERATGKDGFARCESCKKRAPKIYVDHIRAVGKVDAGYFKRLFCPSSGLQALCKDCHADKTREERKALKRKKSFCDQF